MCVCVGGTRTQGAGCWGSPPCADPAAALQVREGLSWQVRTPPLPAGWEHALDGQAGPGGAGLSSARCQVLACGTARHEGGASLQVGWRDWEGRRGRGWGSAFCWDRPHSAEEVRGCSGSVSPCTGVPRRDPRPRQLGHHQPPPDVTLLPSPATDLWTSLPGPLPGGPPSPTSAHADPSPSPLLTSPAETSVPQASDGGAVGMPPREH